MSPVAFGFSSYEVIVVARVLQGLARGISYVTLPLYISEVTTRNKLAFFQGLQVNSLKNRPKLFKYEPNFLFFLMLFIIYLEKKNHYFCSSIHKSNFPGIHASDWNGHRGDHVATVGARFT